MYSNKKMVYKTIPSLPSDAATSSAMTSVPTNAIANISENASLDQNTTHFPHHILEALNDDCLIEILLQKSIGIGDLVEVAATCKRLQAIAKRTFRIKYRRNNNFDEILKWSSEKIERFLKLFGALCETFDLLAFHNHNNRDEISYLAAQYCENVVNFRCFGWRNVDISQLKILCSKATHFESFGDIIGRIILRDNSALQQLRLFFGSVDLPQKQFPELLHLKLDYVRISQENIAGFFRLNPQLKKVELIDSPMNCTGYHLEDGIKHLTNLEELAYLKMSIKSQFRSYNCFENLKNLKKLRLWGEKLNMFNILNAMQSGNVPLESLWLDCIVEEDYRDDGIIDLICHFKGIQQLILKQTITGTQLMQLINNLPQLKDIQCEFETVNCNHLENALRKAKQLRSATIGICRFHTLDENQYYSSLESISTIAKNNNVRVKMLVTLKYRQPEFVFDTIVGKISHENFAATACKFYDYDER